MTSLLAGGKRRRHLAQLRHQKGQTIRKRFRISLRDGRVYTTLSIHGELWLLALVGLAALLAVWRLRALKPAPTLVLAGMLLIVLVWAACGGGGGFVSTNAPAGTPSGSYSLKVTGTYTSASAGTTLGHDTTLTLKVN